MDISIRRLLDAATSTVKAMPGHDPKTLRVIRCLPDSVPVGYNFKKRFEESALMRHRKPDTAYHPDTIIAYCGAMDRLFGGLFPRYPRGPWALTYLAKGALGWAGNRRIPVTPEHELEALTRLNSPLFD
jgi:hypothetical protein